MKSKISETRRSICKILYRPTTIAAAAGDGGRSRATTAAAAAAAAVDGGRSRSTIAASAGDGCGGRGRGFLPTNANSEKPNARRPHTFMKVVEEEAKFGVFKSQLKNEERARRSVLFRAYGQYYGDKKNECDPEYEKCKWVGEELWKVLEKVDAELGGDGAGATQNDRLAETAEGFEGEYEKRYREILAKLLEKMTQDDEPFEFVTNLMIKCEPEYEKLVCDLEFDTLVRGVLQRVFLDDELSDEELSDDELADEEKVGKKKVGNERIRRINDLDITLKIVSMPTIQGLLGDFAIELMLTNLMRVEKMKPLLRSYEVIEKVFKKAGNENIFKIAKQEELLWELEDEVCGLVTNLKEVEMMKPYFMARYLIGDVCKKVRDEKEDKMRRNYEVEVVEEELKAIGTNLLLFNLLVVGTIKSFFMSKWIDQNSCKWMD